MKEYDLVVIGGGISGMTSAISALENGCKNVLILEREETYGGVLNQCIHCGFTIEDEKLAGPEVIGKIKDKLDSYGHDYELKLKTTVLDISNNKKVTFINEEDGIKTIKAKAVILATGCRERYTGSVLIPTSKFTGVFTIGNAHKIINLDGVLPGKNPVIIANSKWALILAIRTELEGGKVEALVVNTESGYKISDEDRKIIDGFDIKVIEKARLLEVAGGRRVNSVKVLDLETLEEKSFNCDSLFLSVGYYPELGMIEMLDIKRKAGKKEIVVEDYKTSIEWMFACGNLIYGDDCEKEKKLGGYVAGLKAYEYLQSLQQAK
ncbi:MAG: NAD(P)/FAD-dependent oxidoreductase [Clostridium sp.]|uniref:NAD(P)/FAD-dependent oxidoreductase n=1 Tax=Clostridium sp. TaxID=1506 RepID=UPI003F3DF31F